jgi:hypothetical protein
MDSAKERAQKLSQEMRSALRAARAGLSRANAAGEEFKALLIEVQAEAAAARNLVEYPAGRYECKGCHQPVIFPEARNDLPPCDNCGRSAGYDGPPPKVLDVVPEAPRKYRAGLYECKNCRAPQALVEGADALPPCEFCGAREFVAV